VLTGLALLAAAPGPAARAQETPDTARATARDTTWRADWGVEEAFALEVHSAGFDYPTAIAVVPEPGPEPDAPLYFVTELGGTIKVVTRDGRVHVFATGLGRRTVVRELPDEQGETGLAGICLAPEQGYVFATYAYSDDAGVLRNGITRFATTPDRFGLEPGERRDLLPLLARYRSTLSHQIGPCVVDGELLWVGVGDGMQTAASRDPDSPLGKILRMTLDGAPAPGNPLGTSDDPDRARSYVWALGLRNPFSLTIARGRLFAAENGPSVDRFFEVRPGMDYLWNGTDWSMGMNAAAVFSPSPAPVQMIYLSPDAANVPPAYRDAFVIAMSGLPAQRGPGNRPGAKGVVLLRYDFETGVVRELPRNILRYRGREYQSVVGVAAAEDGLFVVPLLPDREGRSTVLRLRHAPDAPHPYLVLDAGDGGQIFLQRGCIGCHAVGNRRLGIAGPPLDQAELVARLRARLEDPGWERQALALDTLEQEPWRSFRDARRDVLAAEGRERVRRWLEYRIQEPRFDDPNATMPDLGLTAGEAARVADYLMTPPAAPADASAIDRLREWLPAPRYEFIALAFAVGALLGAGALALPRRVRRE
jgi:glucose/arabinose dehydrogenase